MSEGNSFITGIVIGGLIVGIMTGLTVSSSYEKSAIERGYALYCPTDGNFAWKGECDAD